MKSEDALNVYLSVSGLKKLKIGKSYLKLHFVIFLVFKLNLSVLPVTLARTVRHVQIVQINEVKCCFGAAVK